MHVIRIKSVLGLSLVSFSGSWVSREPNAASDADAMGTLIGQPIA